MPPRNPPHLPRAVTDIAAAFLLLTRFPVRWERFSDEPPDIGRSVWANPIVGWVIGGVGALAFGLASQTGLPPQLAAFLAVAVQFLATGGFHEDGAADVADGFGGGQTAEQKLEIMKDSRIGTYGTLALLVLVGLRVTTLATLAPIATLALVSAGAASRGSILWTLRLLDSARTTGMGASLRRPSGGEMIAGSTLAAGAALLSFSPGTALLALGTGFLSTLALARVARRQIGGYTGDVLGAGQQLFEVFFLLALAASLGT